ncbi:transposase, partial [Bacillus mycoides]|uniref:transposase n=2 Tax=Bacillaceae TaxID=186817 RepID=UPI00053533D8
MKLYSNNHSVFLLYYHLVLVVKYRRNVFDDVHILFKAHPNTEMTKFINAYKSASSRIIKRDFPQVKKKLWKE